MHPYQYQIISGIIYALAIPIWISAVSNKTTEPFSYSGVFIAIVGTILYMIGSVLFNFLIKGSNDLGSITAMSSLSPIITVILSCMFLDEKLTISKIVAFVLAMCSAILINY